MLKLFKRDCDQQTKIKSTTIEIGFNMTLIEQQLISISKSFKLQLLWYRPYGVFKADITLFSFTLSLIAVVLISSCIQVMHAS